MNREVAPSDARRIIRNMRRIAHVKGENADGRDVSRAA